jgi:prepilin-type N-terminal cleavage/methylation domain-containing protein/prepilin-type processing-associated H-X9-DG protein
MKSAPGAAARQAGQRGGFTLVELVVVVVIVAILMSLGLSAYIAVLDRGRGAACVSNLRQLGAGVALYAADHENQLPFGPQGAAFGMSGNLYTSTGAPTSLITLGTGELVGLGLTFPYLKEPKCFFCPGSDQPVDTAEALANVGKKQVQSSYYYRHAGNTNITDVGGKNVSAPRMGALGDNRRGQPIRALVMDSQFLCAPGLKGFGVVSRTHHKHRFSNVLYTDGHVITFVNRKDVLNVDITGGDNAYDSYNMILQKFEMVDTGLLEPMASGGPSSP